MPEWFSTPALRFRVILVTILLIFVVSLIMAAWTALLPFFLGLFLAYLLLPIVNFLDTHAPRALRNRGISRPLAIIIVYIVAIGLVAGILTSFIPVVIEQARILIAAAPNYFERIQQLLTTDLESYLARIPPEIATAINANIARLTASLGTGIQQGVSLTLRTVSQTVSFFIGLAIVPFWLFYVLNDEDRMRRSIYELIPERARDDVHHVAMIINGLLSAYIRGQLVLCLVVGGMATIVLFAFGVNLALLLGTLAGIFEVIPILGPYLGAIPPVLIALVDRPITALWVAISFAAIQQIENLFLVPRISGNAVRFHPALVMVIVVVGSQVAGLWGIILAVPLAATIRDVFRYLYLRTTERGATPQMAMEALRAKSF